MKKMSESRRQFSGKVLAMVIVAALVAAPVVGMAGCTEEIELPYGPRIRDWYDLDAVRNNLGGTYVLMNDLDSTTAGYAELAGIESGFEVSLNRFSRSI